MKANELRLNNLLEVDGVIIKVGKIEEKHITWNLSKKDNLRVWNPFLSINDNRIKPIPLTEEWLLKLPSNLIYPKWIKYLHELQNWYYWNNEKKELELK